MRVALLSCNAQYGDAIGKQVAEKLAFFVERGADVRVFLESLERLHPQVRPWCQVMRADAVGEAWEFVSTADLVCAEFGQYYSLLGLLPLLAGNKTRILVDYHGITPPDLWGEHNRESLEKGLRHRGLVWCADQTLVHSRFIERELLEGTGIPGERLCRLGLPIDGEHFFPGDGSRWRQSRGLEDAALLLYVGRLAPNKRVPMLVEALDRLRERKPEVHALITGDTSDLYQIEADRCRRRARELGVADRLHFLGHVSDAALAEVYQAADVFVMPSRWEGFCIPVLEAMACGLPVVAARAAALPETVAGAGLTFQADDVDDLVRRLRRLLDTKPRLAVRRGQVPPPESGKRHIAVVCFRYGSDFAGGAEWSLRTIAAALCQAGHAVEVFTTCNRAENNWSNDLPAGTSRDGDIPVHRFRLDPHDRGRHLQSVRAILEANGKVSAETEREYLAQAVHSEELMAALRQRRDLFDAVIVGPYLSGLTCDVARAFSAKTLVVPCFHDEPVAHLAVWREVYEQVGAILYHTDEEQDLAQTELGLNHPGAVVIGTWLESSGQWPVASGQKADSTDRYVVYCGRYSAQKELPALLDFARRYNDQQPGRFTFVFMGQGEMAIPRAAWARDLGFVSPEEKRRIMGKADALIQLSRNESLSLVALEAWSLGTPVIANRAGAVLSGHIGRCGGGRAVGDYESFARALDDLWEKPVPWQTRGRQGQEYVRARYGSEDSFRQRLEEALGNLTTSLWAQLRQRGLERAAQFNRITWRESFGRLVDKLLDGAPLPDREWLEVLPHKNTYRTYGGARSMLIPVRVVNRGSRPALAEGPARSVLCCRVWDPEKKHTLGPRLDTPLPGLLLPGRSQPAAICVPVPATAGPCQVLCWAQRAAALTLDGASESGDFVASMRPATIDWVVQTTGSGQADMCAPLLESVQAALAEANRCRRLPDDYLDVTEGWLAPLKRWLKRKLLNNFKHAYVDVLSRQQSRVNQQLLTAVQELAECCATLDHAVRLLQETINQRPALDSALDRPDPGTNAPVNIAFDPRK